MLSFFVSQLPCDVRCYYSHFTERESNMSKAVYKICSRGDFYPSGLYEKHIEGKAAFGIQQTALVTYLKKVVLDLGRQRLPKYSEG